MVDEQFSDGLRDKVHRGQEGRVLQGLTAGGRCFGYNNIPIEDPTRPGKYGRLAVIGVSQQINQQEAAVVRRIFEMYAGGLGLAGIAKQLNAEGIPSPRPAKNRTRQVWSRYSIREMLHNERYRGVMVWNRTRKVRDPETGRKVSRARPAAEWKRVEVPALRIIPEELWCAAHKRNAEVNRLGITRLGGLCRTQRSRTYLFSGLLKCADCGSSMVICAGGGRRGYVKYGCHTHKQSGVCDNKLMIRQDRLEEQLLADIEQRLLNPDTLDYAVNRCEEELKRRLAKMERQGSITTQDSLKKQRQDMEARRGRLIQAIEISGSDLSGLTNRLRDVEGEISRLNEAIAVHRPVRPNVAVDGIRDHVMKSIMSLGETLKAGDISLVKEALAKHIGKLVMTPVQRGGRPVYQVSGNVVVQTGDTSERCRMQLVARDGIEPPTPAFSGL